MTVPMRWRKSSRSGQETNCVEIAHTLGAVRDSKNADGPVLAIDMSGMLTAVKSGSLDRHAK